jgi:crotonobetainyl-CoA:carnitine CoA-transferase CaiB-like acyl-CoA transferase
MLTRTAAEWEQLLNEAQVPASRVRTLEEAVVDPQVAHRGALASPASGLRHPIAAFTADHDGPAVGSQPPEMGADTDAILAAIGIDADLRAVLRARGVI